MSHVETRRIAFTVHYDGEPFHGWQLQKSDPSVQGELETVLSRLFDGPTRIVGAGRTDTGVHSTGQVGAVNAPLRWRPDSLRLAVNALLPETIWLSHAAEVANDFHPRYGATSRHYIYRVGIDEMAASPFHRRWCWPLCRAVDRELMAEAARQIVGEHSFKAFAKAGQEERGDRCNVMEANWLPWGSMGIEFQVGANRFLHHMVRYLVGTMVEIGRGKRPLEDLVKLLHGGAPLLTSAPAPAQGLYLTEVRYPPGSYNPTSAQMMPG